MDATSREAWWQVAFKMTPRHPMVSLILNITSYATGPLQKVKNMMEGISYDVYIYKNAIVRPVGYINRCRDRKETECQKGRKRS